MSSKRAEEEEEEEGEEGEGEEEEEEVGEEAKPVTVVEQIEASCEKGLSGKNAKKSLFLLPRPLRRRKSRTEAIMFGARRVLPKEGSRLSERLTLSIVDVDG